MGAAFGEFGSAAETEVGGGICVVKSKRSGGVGGCLSVGRWGVYVKAGLEKEKAALLVVVAGLSDGRKVFLAITSGYRESVGRRCCGI